jgi:catechol 2,3-dioxygenase-like lactoylglutathione lyase family enzyme
MSSQLDLKGYHHLTLTVTDLGRSREFYTGILGFSVIAEFTPTRSILGNDNMLISIGEASDPSQVIAGDRFNENRVGLDHLSFTVESFQELERAQKLFSEAGVRHAEIKELTDFGIAVMMFWDPDNIQLELTAPLG